MPLPNLIQVGLFSVHEQFIQCRQTFSLSKITIYQIPSWSRLTLSWTRLFCVRPSPLPYSSNASFGSSPAPLFMHIAGTATCAFPVSLNCQADLWQTALTSSAVVRPSHISTRNCVFPYRLQQPEGPFPVKVFPPSNWVSS